MDPKGRDASLLAKKLKEHIAESQSRKQEEGRKISNTGDSWKQRRFVELNEQIERLVAELPPAKERTEEQKAELQRMVKEKCKMMMQRTGRGLAEEDQHLAPERNERERLLIGESRKQKDGRKKSTVQKELAEEDQVEHTVEHSQENSLHTPTFKQGSPANKEGGTGTGGRRSSKGSRARARAG